MILTGNRANSRKAKANLKANSLKLNKTNHKA
jgi:hypothetical protein